MKFFTTEGPVNCQDHLLEAFLAFWRQHGEPLLGSAPYHEIAPHPSHPPGPHRARPLP